MPFFILLSAFFDGYYQAESRLIRFLEKDGKNQSVIKNPEQLKAEYRELIKTQSDNTENKFRGNPIEDRKNGNYENYKMAAVLTRTFNEKYPGYKVRQKEICYLVGINESTICNWKGREQNKLKFETWKKEASENEINRMIPLIESYLKGNSGIDK